MIRSTSFLTALAASAPVIAGGSFVNLGGSVTPTGVSADGSVVAASIFGGPFFKWTSDDGLVNIGGNANAGNASVSADGTRIGGSILNPDSGLNEMALYDVNSGMWTALGGLGSSCDTSTSSGWGMSGDGNILVGLGWVPACRAHGIAWSQSTGMVDLGSTVVDRSSRANAANFDGSVIVGWQDGATGFRQAAVWVNGVQSVITTPGGDPISEAAGVSADGTWVIGSGASTNGFNAWRWSSSTGLQNIGAAPVSGWRGASTAISADGSVIVGFHRPFPGPATFGQGFIWTEADGMINLNTYVASQGVDTQGITLALPLAISADGRTIAGLGSGGVGFIVRLPALKSPCSGDFDGSGSVDFSDLLVLLSAWGPCAACAEDLDGSGNVDFSDLLALLTVWGDC